jgi:hypothetical protein
MLPTESANLAIVVVMFVLRLAVPLVVTLALGYWLENKLQPPADKTPGTRRSIQQIGGAGSARSGPPGCWDLRQDEAARRAEGVAGRHPGLPCWLALQVEGDKVRPECFVCARYTSHANAA